MGHNRQGPIWAMGTVENRLLPNAAKSITFNELHSVLADVKTESW